MNRLLVRITPRANLQPAANPTESFGRIRRARRAAHHALRYPLELIGLERLFSALQQRFVDVRFLVQRLTSHTAVFTLPRRASFTRRGRTARRMPDRETKR